MAKSGAARPLIAVEPECWRRQALAEAVVAGGGRLADPQQATGLVWAEPADFADLPPMLAQSPGIGWVQLPYAGIENVVGMLDRRLQWTCGKGVYAEPVAELALGLALAGLRGLRVYGGADTWLGPQGRNLLDAQVCILGGGGITESLVRLLGPWNCRITVVRKHPVAMAGVDEVVGIAALLDALRGADVVVVALSLTPETVGIIDAEELAAMRPHAWLVNVARGGHIVTEALVQALAEKRIGGAALDVTDPEPLPDDHPLWRLDNCIITPHVGNTPEMGLTLLARRVTENVRRFASGEALLGPVDVDLGY